MIRKHTGLLGPRNPLLLAHRGYSRLAPENTLPAFALAREHRIPGVELDVHLCRTGEVVVIHDDTVDRTTNGTGRVTDLTLEELRRLDAGAWKDEKYKDTRIPLLSEVFALLGDSVIYDVELKIKTKKTASLAEAVLKEIQKAGLEQRCVVTSFNPLAIKAIRKLAPHIAVGIIYTDNEELPSYLRAGQGRFFTRCSVLKPDYQKISQPFMAYYAKLLRYPVLPWTVDDPEKAEELMKKGASGIISNDPGPLKPLFNLP